MAYIVKIRKDEHAESPRNDDNIGIMACFHRRYNLGDSDKPDIETVQKIERSPDYISLPLYLYDHSGLTISTKPFSCPWDSGRLGLIYVKRDDVIDLQDERVLEILRSEVEIYDQYLRGDIYGYELIRTEDDGAEITEDSCWGFYGSDPDVNGMAAFIGQDIMSAAEVYVQ